MYCIQITINLPQVSLTQRFAAVNISNSKYCLSGSQLDRIFITLKYFQMNWFNYLECYENCLLLLYLKRTKKKCFEIYSSVIRLWSNHCKFWRFFESKLKIVSIMFAIKSNCLISACTHHHHVIINHDIIHKKSAMNETRQREKHRKNRNSKMGKFTNDSNLHKYKWFWNMHTKCVHIVVEYMCSRIHYNVL